jgi:thiol-disulfide isomerase/thioredoxin
MSAYRLTGLLVATAAVFFVVGHKLGRTSAAAPALALAPAQPATAGAEGTAECCGPLPASARNVGTPPAIPTGSGLPCLAEFASGKCEACKKLGPVLDKVAARVRGKVDVVRVSTDLYPEEATRWRLRLVPTLVFLDAKGAELGRHEGYLSLDELMRKLSAMGIRVQ